MATAAQVLKTALLRIISQGAEADLQPDEFDDAIFAMNNYMFDLDARGVRLGYTQVTNLADNITVPLGALRGVIANVAIEIAPDFGGEISPGLVRAAKEGLEAMEELGVVVTTSVFPSTLPIGSGNEHNDHGLSNRFFPDLEREILAETTGAIGLEVGTEEFTL